MASNEQAETPRGGVPLRLGISLVAITLLGLLLFAWLASTKADTADDCPDPSSSDRLCVGEIVCSENPGSAPVIRPDADNNCPEGWHQNVVQPDAVCFLALELAQGPFDLYATCSKGCEDKGTIKHIAYANRCCTGKLRRVCKPRKKRWF